jgi:hypothetical protein
LPTNLTGRGQKKGDGGEVYLCQGRVGDRLEEAGGPHHLQEARHVVLGGISAAQPSSAQLLVGLIMENASFVLPSFFCYTDISVSLAAPSHEIGIARESLPPAQLPDDS